MPLPDLSGDGTIKREKQATDSSDEKGRYAPPSLVRVRVRAARTTLGTEFSDAFCTIHIHDNAGDGCSF